MSDALFHSILIFGLVGPDGAGKTNTMRMLTAIMQPISGDAWVAGHHIVKEGEAIKVEIGYMSQKFGLYPDLTAMENIDFYADVSVRKRLPTLCSHQYGRVEVDPFCRKGLRSPRFDLRPDEFPP
ncbi:MAG TPA: ATP-binding cassette domain-containing protein [Planctomycetaceae bacterium]|nr:ATP-binding cassette domain-containing protein [Planctomycetaceae bacterium]